MKLYSTITSERATKGQGGNTCIVIEIKDENGDKLALFKAYAPKQLNQAVDAYIVHWVEIDRQGKETGQLIHGEAYGRQSKGNQQKDEAISCENHAYYREDCGECRRLN